MKIVRKMLVKNTTRILPPFEMPLPPAFNQFSISEYFVPFFILLIVFVFFIIEIESFHFLIGKERRERRKEKEKGKSAKVQRIKRFSACFARKRITVRDIHEAFYLNVYNADRFVGFFICQFSSSIPDF